ncbi:hypothetical protein G7B40_000555 [Aetokthonos hydrillicola Thurmond2011]|jgi:hypothetical protein|uniref:Uncharacterized protein n=1 Tax=Aetokthonos hydrillicola Thurmond2011 TaxID=2712845 RepID=A0AAP5I0S4_9CYAN|nr:hypothetical protein [Aetokthonos hydrillicola]MBO3460476.1 hypothetical protein [Aetokthonos hydrillicola CCALA 1050]MBW4588236.1 hypothetical protein [Aetokthonos hydrillicola CCALA 1050]MDR9893077.1 hypothetical protein [Aetokthonos hydrillicola Thurmond2011]
MKLVQIAFVVLVLLINLASPLNTLADEVTDGSKYPNYLVGQKIVWLYKPRANSSNVQRIVVEVVKLGSKKVLVRVRKKNNEFVDRWVNPDKLENP